MDKKILVVDDEEDIGLLMRVMLSTSGYNVLYAKNLDDAREILLHDNPEIVFLDLNLGNEYGMTLLPAIRKNNSDIDIVIITAQKDLDLHIISPSNSVRKIIEKPFNKNEILSVLKNCA